jgi:microcystin-dependent protein
MAEPFIAEIRIMSFGFAPKGWALANGQLLPINQNQALFSLLGTTFGGDGRTNFALPDNRGRTPIHVGNGHTLGERAGEQNHTLAFGAMPVHTHTLNAVSSGSASSNVQTAVGASLATSTPNSIYTTGISNLGTLNAGTVANAGGSQAHENMQPYLVLNFCIALQGIFPSRN